MDDTCRLRYDGLLFASESCRAGKIPKMMEARTRKMLELGALSLLEAEVENMFLNKAQPREQQKAYPSCLDAMIESHYGNLRNLDSCSSPKAEEARGVSPWPSSSQHKVEGSRAHALSTSEVVGRLPNLMRPLRSAEDESDDQHRGDHSPEGEDAGDAAGIADGSRTHQTQAREWKAVPSGEQPSVVSAGVAMDRPRRDGSAVPSLYHRALSTPPPNAAQVLSSCLGVEDGDRDASDPGNKFYSLSHDTNRTTGPNHAYTASRACDPTGIRVPGIGTASEQGSTGVANLYGRTLSSAPIRGGRSGGLTGGLTPVGKGAHAAEAWAAREAAREGSSYACALDDSREKSSHDRPVRRAFTTARQLQADMDPRSRNRREGWERQGEDGSDQRGGDGLGTNGTWGRQRQSNGAVGDERHRGGISAHRGINKTSVWGEPGARYVEREGQTFSDAPAPSPRLPNGSGLVRKRKFVPPGRLDNTNSNGNAGGSGGGGGKFPGSAALGAGRARGDGAGKGAEDGGDDNLPEELQHLEKTMVDKIVQEIQQRGDPVTFDQIAGLEFAKKSVIELVCWPMARPDIFTGLRSLPKGLLLFGPPGTGKTLIGKAIAHQSGATFFSISASSLCSKWIGEGEKLVRTLFAVAGYYQPAVIFIDEVDSMLSMRSADENEASRRLKTEFLIQLDGAGTKSSDRVLVVGATNRPQELDEAARRRFVKRLYVPLPDKSGRRQLMEILLKSSAHSLSQAEVEAIVEDTEGFSGADLHALCTEAAMGPVRDLGSSICSVRVSDVPPMETRHFEEARRSMRPSVGPDEIAHYIRWNEEFGSFKRER